METFVQGDDPLTSEIEPIVPFKLGLLLINKGFGKARNLTIQSFQPQIVDNEKGLPVDFKIISTTVNGDKYSLPSLLVNLGDVNSMETKESLWLFSASLKGTFTTLNATYTNINPNGDPKLSLIDKIEFKRLIRTVLVDVPIKKDNLLDFFVWEDLTLFPNKVNI